MSSIRHYQPMLYKALAARGWQIESIQCPTIWCVDAWQLTSTWSPPGVQVLLLFEHDDHLCWVAARPHELHGQIDTLNLSRLYLKRGIDRDLPQFLASLDALRTSAVAQK